MQQKAPWENDKPVSQGDAPWENDRPLSEAAPDNSKYKTRFDAVSRGLSKGVMLGMDDELVSGALAATVGTAGGVIDAVRERDVRAIPRTIGEVYRYGQNLQRQEDREIRDKYPVTMGAAQFAGAAGSGAASGGKFLAGQAGKRLVAGSAGLGAAEGGVAGFFSSEGGLGDRSKGAVQGAALGGALGAGSTALAQGVSRFWQARKAGGQRLTEGAKKQFNYVRDALAADMGGQNPKGSAEAALRVWNKNGADPNELFDMMGDRGRFMIEKIAADRPQKAMAMVNEWKDRLGRNIKGRIIGTLNRDGRRVPGADADLMQIRQSQAGPIFEEVLSQNVLLSDLGSAMRRPAVKRAIAQAKGFMRDRGNAATFKPEATSAADDLMRQVMAVRERVAPPKNKSLTQFIVEMGGISDDRGDILSTIGGSVRGRPGLINRTSGRQIDEVIEAASESGMFPGREAGDLPTRSEFLAILDDDFSGRVTSGLFDDVDDLTIQRAMADFDRIGLDYTAPADDLAKQVEQITGAKLTPDTAPTFEVLQRAKEVLDDRIGALHRGGSKKRAEDIRRAKNALLVQMDAANPRYREARMIWAGTMEAEEAMDLGKGFLRETYNADDLMRDLRDMGPSEREFYRIGVIDSFERKLDSIADGRNPASLLKNENMRKKLRLLFADEPEEAEALIEYLTRARDGFAKRSTITSRSGSPTQPRMQEQQRFEDAIEGPIARNILEGLANPTRIPHQLARLTRDGRRQALAEQWADDLSEIFFGGRQLPIPAPQGALPATNSQLRLGGGQTPLLTDERR